MLEPVKGPCGECFLFINQKNLAVVNPLVHEYTDTDRDNIQKKKDEAYELPVGARVTAKLRCLALRSAVCKPDTPYCFYLLE